MFKKKHKIQRKEINKFKQSIKKAFKLLRSKYFLIKIY